MTTAPTSPHPKSTFAKTVALKTIGCKFNQSETDTLAQLFYTHGYEIKPFGQSVGVTVINTCTVTNAADRDCRNLIGQAQRASPHGYIVVTGCYAQMAADQLKKMEGVNLVVGNQQKQDIPKLVDNIRSASTDSGCPNATTDNPIKSPKYQHDAVGRQILARTRAFVRIQDGCNFFCAYCIVPHVRGLPCSEGPDKIKKEIQDLVACGHQEIVLTGINMGLYGNDTNNPDCNLISLLKHIVTVPGLKRLRLSSLEPNTITDDLLTFIAGHPVICPHLHIPLQSGDDEILLAMNRKYSSGQYQNLMKRFIKHLPTAALGTDIITGFPGETDAHFANTLTFVSHQPFSHMHVFSFSPRPGTPAALLKNTVNDQVIKKRTNTLRALGNKMKSTFAAGFVGQTVPVLIDSLHKNACLGYTPHYLRVTTDPKGLTKGEIAQIKLVSFDKNTEVFEGQCCK